MKRNQYNIGRAEGIRIETFKAYDSEDFCEVAQSFRQNHQQVERVEEDKGEEIAVISVPKTVINEWTVMIEVLHTLATNGAVEGCL